MKRRTGSWRAREEATGPTLKFFHHVPIPALVWAALIFCMPALAPAMQILDAVDHAELEAEISDRAVSRIALAGDRIARVIRGPDSFVVEHDAARGDVYLRPGDPLSVGVDGFAAREPLSLFVGTVAGFTYRLALTVTDRGSAQILIRNAATESREELATRADGRVEAVVTLVRAVVRREPLPQYAIEAAAGKPDAGGLAVVETWRGPRFTARLLEAEAGSDPDAGDLAGRLAADTAAVWVGPPGSGPSGGRLVAAVADRSGNGSVGRKP